LFREGIVFLRLYCRDTHPLTGAGRSHRRRPVSIIFGESDRYLNPSLAREIAGLFADPSVHLLHGASHWPQHDQPQVVADLLADIASAETQR
jgi:pimeloyl-ACP methyl ester carboxylesterase